MITLGVNGSEIETDSDPDTPLLWVIRDLVGLHGTKFGCGIGMCGACTVHLDRAMSGMLCRCAAYQRIREAIHRAAEVGSQ